jgi:hypothetical protein
MSFWRRRAVFFPSVLDSSCGLLSLRTWLKPSSRFVYDGGSTVSAPPLFDAELHSAGRVAARAEPIATLKMIADNVAVFIPSAPATACVDTSDPGQFGAALPACNRSAFSNERASDDTQHLDNRPDSSDGFC